MGYRARRFGRWLQYAVPSGYQRQQPVKRPILGPWVGVIDAILQDDKQRPAKQKHTAKRIFDRLEAEHGFSGGYTTVKKYVRGEHVRGRERCSCHWRTRRVRRRRTFHPSNKDPLLGTPDFGEALVIVAGVECKAHYLVMDLPHSDDCFVRAFPAETTEAFLPPHGRGPVRGGPGLKVTCEPSSILGRCRRAFCMTTPRLQWPRSWAASSGRGRALFL